jgi:hypothetical protein
MSYFYLENTMRIRFSSGSTSMPPGSASSGSVSYRRNLVSRLRERAIHSANQICRESPKRPECAIAWDLVEDYDHTLRRMKQVMTDPMEELCMTSPSDLECREYDL